MSKSQLKALGKLIASERAKRGLSLEALGTDAGVSRATVLRLERGEFGRPDPEKLQRIARALELDVEDLFALAGYTPGEGLPNFGPYLRTKHGKELSASDRRELERHFEKLREKRTKGGSRGSAR
jgi:transcriptional regulator with XRE-family HTH domain